MKTTIINHPKLGQILVTRDKGTNRLILETGETQMVDWVRYDSRQAKSHVLQLRDGVINQKLGGKKGSELLIRISPEDYAIIEEWKEAEKFEKLAIEKEAEDFLRAGKRNFELRYYEGEILSGYGCCDPDSKILGELGLARYIDGWGTYVEPEIIKTLSESFNYQQAVDFTQPAREAKTKAANERANAKTKIFATAKETGKKQVLRSYMADCNEEDCSCDNITVYAMPDGTTKTERQHTW